MGEVTVVAGSLVAIAAVIAVAVLAVRRRDKRLGLAAAVLAVLVIGSPFLV